MSEKPRISWWNIVSFWAVTVILAGAGTALVESYKPQLWVGVITLGCACVLHWWTLVHNASENDLVKRTPREMLLGVSGERIAGIGRMWSWHNYPFLLFFLFFFLAFQEFALLYGFWRALFLTVGTLLLTVVVYRFYAQRRRKKKD